MSKMNRRTLLAGTAAAAGTAVLGPIAAVEPARASAPLAGKQAPGFYRYKLGSYEITTVTDGAITFPLGDTFVINAKKDEVNDALEAAFMPRDRMTIVFNPVVVNTGSKLILIDTGLGPKAPPNSAAGQLMNNLAASGIDPKAIDTVVISHFHADHVNGLLTTDEKLAFPNAEVMVPAKEWAFWMDDGEMSRAPAGRMADLFKNNRRVFDALARKVTQYPWDKEVLPGITAVGTPGHTPGHTSYTIASGSDQVFVFSDVTNHPALFIRNPGWHAFFDQDADMAEATRRKVADRLAADKMLVQAFHFPFPSVSYIQKDGNGYRAIPIVWNAQL
jgi:glyoxylase-like metal-dependent hydrolase (beta-lactamase superfamily II)